MSAFTRKLKRWIGIASSEQDAVDAQHDHRAARCEAGLKPLSDRQLRLIEQEARRQVVDDV